jgi:hypothetical protein
VVGKATAGDYWPNSYKQFLRKSSDDAIDNRLVCNREFVRKRDNGKAFWNYFGQLADLDPGFGLDSVTWSNVAKIGSMTGNPSGLLLLVRADLAERTLRAEIDQYNPARRSSSPAATKI